MIAWYDLSPMRPDEFAEVDSERWTEAVSLRRAMVEGREQADTEQAMAERLKTQLPPVA